MKVLIFFSWFDVFNIVTETQISNAEFFLKKVVFTKDNSENEEILLKVTYKAKIKT